MSKELEKLVIIESPFRGENYEETAINILYARACVHDSLLKGEFPFASHLLYTQDGVLDDKIEEERMLGINAGVAWGKIAKKRAVYQDRGISKGMEWGIRAAEKEGQLIEYRSLPNYEEFLGNLTEEDLKEGYEFIARNGKFSEKKS
ncbi:MAG: hypothetical protein Q8Q04_00570 [archaeon]|nr:hypothetical protein [archaeon]